MMRMHDRLRLEDMEVDPSIHILVIPRSLYDQMSEDIKGYDWVRPIPDVMLEPGTCVRLMRSEVEGYYSPYLPLKEV